jgi:hypothetical protein
MTDFVALLEDQLLAAHARRPRGVWTWMPSRRGAGALVATAAAAAAIVLVVLLLASPGGHGDARVGAPTRSTTPPAPTAAPPATLPVPPGPPAARPHDALTPGPRGTRRAYSDA